MARYAGTVKGSQRFLLFSKLRDPISALSHYAGALAAVIGLFVLLDFSDQSLAWIVSLVVYGASLILLFSASAIYHSVMTTPKNTEIFRKVDHSAIYLLIAGSYTPFCVNAFSGFWQWGFLAVIWALAVVGVALKVFIIRAPRWLTAGVYVVMGWLSIFAIQEMLAALPGITILWLFTGGIVYTAGAVVYITKRMDFVPGFMGFHEIWHIFVLLGAAAHFMAVLSLLK